MTKYLVGVSAGKYLLDLPLDAKDLDEGIRQQVFPTGKPQQCAMAHEIREYVRHMPLRKDNRLLQSGTQVVSSAASSAGGGLAIEDVCKVVEACGRTFQPQIERMQSGQSSTASERGEVKRPVLAICDRSEVDQSVVLPKEEVKQEPEPVSMSVEEQLASFRDDLPAAAGMKRPAASVPTVRVPKAKGRPRAQPDAASMQTTAVPKAKGRPRSHAT